MKHSSQTGCVLDSTVDHCSKVTTGDAASASCNGVFKNKVLHPATIELALRKSITDSPKQSIWPLRVAMNAAQIFGNDWFSIAAAIRALVGYDEERTSRKCAERMTALGLAEFREHKDGKQLIIQARIKVRLFDMDHTHGLTSMRIARDINRYYDSKSRASALPALLLVAIHNEQLKHFSDLREFCGPDYLFVRGCAAFFKIIHAFQDAGIVTLFQERPNSRGTTLVIPVEQT
jgi:hypothetical protein